jgi:hypothetical protein
MDELSTVTSWLPDITSIPLAELADRIRDDPALQAAINRVVARIVDREPIDGCGC